MAANTNPKTGIAYGVVDARNLPYLLDEILSSGTDNRYEEAKREIVASLTNCQGPDEANAIIRDLHYAPDQLLLDEHDFEDGSITADLDDLASEILSDTYELDSDNFDHEYEMDGFKYHLGSLGGAPLIWVLESPFLANCRPCSPCVPGAGDLDNIVGMGEGMVAYCFDPDDFDPHAEGPRPYKAVRLAPGEPAWVLPADEATDA